MEFERQLINLVRERKCLYQTKSRSNTNNQERFDEWERVSAALNRPVIDCRQRWRSLRDRFVREKKKLDLGDISPNCEQQWEYYNELKFLIPSVKPRRQRRERDEQGAIIYIKRDLSDNFVNVSNSRDEGSPSVVYENVSFDEMFDAETTTLQGFNVESKLNDANENLLSEEEIQEQRELVQISAFTDGYELSNHKDWHTTQELNADSSSKDETEIVLLSEEDIPSKEFSTKRLASTAFQQSKDQEWNENDFSKFPMVKIARLPPNTGNSQYFPKCFQNNPSTSKQSEQVTTTTVTDSNEAFFDLMKSLKAEVNKILIDEKDENDLFLECMGKKMKNLSQRAKLKIQAKLLAVITEELLNEIPE